MANGVIKRIHRFCTLITDKKGQKELVDEEKIFTKSELKDREKLIKRKDKRYKSDLKRKVNFVIIAGLVFIVIGLMIDLIAYLVFDFSIEAIFFLGLIDAMAGALIVVLGLLSKFLIRATENLEKKSK